MRPNHIRTYLQLLHFRLNVDRGDWLGYCINNFNGTLRNVFRYVQCLNLSSLLIDFIIYDLLFYLLTGFVVSSACENERTATYMAMGSFLPIVMLCGIIWPIEGMYPGLKYIALFLPLTKSTECLRSITQRGWSISEPDVYSGFISTGAWVLVFLTISILLLKFKKG